MNMDEAHIYLIAFVFFLGVWLAYVACTLYYTRRRRASCKECPCPYNTEKERF